MPLVEEKGNQQLGQNRITRTISPGYVCRFGTIVDVVTGKHRAANRLNERAEAMNVASTGRALTPGDMGGIVSGPVLGTCLPGTIARMAC